jgi:hypothetical protein
MVEADQTAAWFAESSRRRTLRRAYRVHYNFACEMRWYFWGRFVTAADVCEPLVVRYAP